MPSARINFLDLNFDLLTFEELKYWLQSVSPATPYAYLVTPNVQHMIQVHGEPDLRQVYDDASFCVCDSRILRLLARLSGIRLPLIPGSDLVEALFASVIRPGDRIAVVGGTDAMVARLSARYPYLDVCHLAPPMGLRHNLEARQAAAAFIAGSKARFTLIAVGMPQQEMIASEVRNLPGAGGVAFCIGAGLDFLVGEQKRAPKYVQRLNLEWAHRVVTNPRRLWRRYLVEGWKIFPIYLGWRRLRAPCRTSASERLP